MTINAPQAAARIREALEAPITFESSEKWRANVMRACTPSALRAILDRMDELAKDAARLDWIDAYAEVIFPKAVRFKTNGMHIWSGRPGAGELREAIDAALNKD